MTTRGDCEKYHSGIPNRLISAVFVSYVSEQRVLRILPPAHTSVSCKNLFIGLVMFIQVTCFVAALTSRLQSVVHLSGAILRVQLQRTLDDQLDLLRN